MKNEKKSITSNEGNKLAMVYANPLQKSGLGEPAEIIEVIKDFNGLKFCKVQMLNTGIYCNAFINERNIGKKSNPIAAIKAVVLFLVMTLSLISCSTTKFVLSNEQKTDITDEVYAYRVVTDSTVSYLQINYLPLNDEKTSFVRGMDGIIIFLGSLQDFKLFLSDLENVFNKTSTKITNGNRLELDGKIEKRLLKEVCIYALDGRGYVAMDYLRLLRLKEAIYNFTDEFAYKVN